MGAGATSTVGGLSLAQSPRLGPRTAVGGNAATMWSLGYGLCPGLDAGRFAPKRVVLS